MRALSRRCQVLFAVGGVPFAGSPAHGPWETLALPPIARRDGKLTAPGGDLRAVLAARAGLLRDHAARFRPDVIVTEHFPFSRWEHRDEIQAAFAASGGARRVASLRDIALRGRFDGWSDAPATPEALDRRYGREVVPVLNGTFHQLLVHGDPRVTRLEDQVSWAGRIAIPIAYTGYVADVEAETPPVAGDGEPFVLLSGGGGHETRALAEPLLEAWRGRGRLRLRVLCGPLAGEDDVAALVRRAGRDATVERAAAAGTLRGLMRRSALSISRAGYNTCVDVLASRTRALLSPSPTMSDQRLRAERLAALGLATLLAPGDDPRARVEAALAAPAPAHDLVLGGAETSAHLIEAQAR